MKVFISHITEEQLLAECLKRWIDDLFLGNHDVFVSSDHESILLGKEWMEQIDFALKESAVILMLCSPISVTRPWISFELGCGWIKKIPIIPICHSGMEKNKLPGPIGLLQAVDLHEPDFLKKLLHNLAKELNSKKTPLILDNMIQELLQVESTLGQSKDSNANFKAPTQVPMDEGDIKAHLESWFLSKNNDERELVVNFTSVDEKLGLPAGAAKKYLKSIVVNRSYKVSQEGNSSIRFAYSPQIVSARRHSSILDNY